MALSMAELRKLVDGEGFRYYLDPDRDALMMGASGVSGRFQFVVHLDVEGQFLQFRTVGYLRCPANHRNLSEVLKLLGQVNYRLRLVKFAWDPSDGEIVAYADVWLMDGKLTQKQFGRMLHTFLPSIDINYARILATRDTGKDPGELDPVAMAKKLIEELSGAGQDDSEDEPPEITEI